MVLHLPAYASLLSLPQPTVRPWRTGLPSPPGTRIRLAQHLGQMDTRRRIGGERGELRIAYLGVGRLAILEDQPGREALDPIRRNRSGIFIRVKFHYFELALVLSGECLDEVCWPIDRCSSGF